jgi:hypothetical protein
MSQPNKINPIQIANVVASKAVDVVTNRKYIHARINEYNQMRLATIQIEQSFCQALNGLMSQKLPVLEKILKQEINESYVKPDIQNSIKGTIETIISDILEDENTKEIMLKHLRSGCLVDDHAAQEIEKKQKILADLKERDFINRLNSSIPMSGGNVEEDHPGLAIDSEDAIANAVCDIYKRLFKSWPNSLQSTAVDSITRVIKTNDEIQSSIYKMVISVIKKTFQAKAFREVFIKQLAGGCYKPLNLPKEAAKLPLLIPKEKPTFKESVALNPGKVIISKDAMHLSGGGGRTEKRRRSSSNRKTKKQYGGHQIMTHLSLSTLAKRAFPNIKSCMCDKIKLMYMNTTPAVFRNYSSFFKNVVEDPSLIEYAKNHYETFLDGIMHSPNTQIKIDLRKHINGECPPLQDPELKFADT